MPSSPARRSSTSSAGNLSKGPIDPITRTALRYTISPREYEALHRYLISRAPRRVQKRAPKPPRYESITKSDTENGDYNVAAVRTASRVFVVSYIGLKGWELVTEKLASKREASPNHPTTTARHPNVRVALSFSSILLLHRLLHRFFKRLRASLLEESAEPFRRRNPKVARLLTSAYTPAVGASLAGFLLGISPATQLRMSIAIYAFTRSLEFGYNALEEGGFLWDEEKGKPWWFGSWLLMPFACGQLLHAFVFDRECFPETYSKFILGRSPEYIQLKPSAYPKEGKPWPGTFDIVDALGSLSKSHWPPFVSPILFPKTKQSPLSSPTLAKIVPISAPAHPSIKNTSCAVLHPHDPSCSRTYLKYWLSAFPSMVKFFTLLYGAFAILAYKKLLKDPIPFLNNLSARIIRISLFVTGAIGTSWASVCFFANYLPRHVLPTQRWFLGGFLGGLWAYIARQNERSTFLYSVRLSIDSLYKVGKKRRWWRGIQNGDVLLFVASLALLDFVYEFKPGAVREAALRKGLGVLRGEGWVDRAAVSGKEGDQKKDSV